MDGMSWMRALGYCEGEQDRHFYRIESMDCLGNLMVVDYSKRDGSRASPAVIDGWRRQFAGLFADTSVMRAPPAPTGMELKGLTDIL